MIAATIDITPEQRKLILSLLQRYLPNTTAWVYGSRVKWTSVPRSDLDMVVFTAPEQRLRVSDLREAFEESNLPFRVDLFVWNDIPDNFKKNIKAEHVVLVEKDEPSARDWSEVTIGEVAEVVGGGTPSSKVEEYWGGGIAWLTPKDLSGHPYRRIKKGGRNITDTGLRKSGARLLPPDAVLITCRAPIGYVALAAGEVSTSQGFRSLILKKGYDPEFFYYLVKHNVPELEAASSGTTFKEISGNTIKQIKIKVPTYPEQRAIARILGSLDDKIEHNRQMSETLEAMAQALFKSWFIDFDPVIDNALAAGNPIPEELQARAQRRKSLSDTHKPLPTNIRNLFPSEFHPTQEMGWIPKGWEVSTIGDEFNVTMGQSPPGSTYNEEGDGVPFFQGRADFSFRYPSNRIYCTEPKRFAQKGDTLVSVRAPVGDINMAREDCCIGRGIGAIRHKSGSRSFTYYSMLQHKEDFKKFEAEGTVFGSISQQDLKAIKWLKSGEQSIEAFDQQAKEFDRKIEECASNIRDISMLRDALIPKLLSGNIIIPEAGNLAENK